jgi:hypothetical protein
MAMNHGGARKGAGRKPVVAGTPRTVDVSVPLTPDEAANLDDNRGKYARAEALRRAAKVLLSPHSKGRSKILLENV